MKKKEKRVDLYGVPNRQAEDSIYDLYYELLLIDEDNKSLQLEYGPVERLGIKLDCKEYNDYIRYMRDPEFGGQIFEALVIKGVINRYNCYNLVLTCAVMAINPKTRFMNVEGFNTYINGKDSGDLRDPLILVDMIESEQKIRTH